MRRLLFFLLSISLIACSSDDTPDRVVYDITYTAAVANGATLNKVQYRDSNGDLVELENVSSPWSISLRVRAGLALEAAAFADVPTGGSVSITAVWKPDGGLSQNETETLSNTEPNTVINNGRVDIEGRTLPDL